MEIRQPYVREDTITHDSAGDVLMHEDLCGDIIAAARKLSAKGYSLELITIIAAAERLQIATRLAAENIDHLKRQFVEGCGENAAYQRGCKRTVKVLADTLYLMLTDTEAYHESIFAPEIVTSLEAKDPTLRKLMRLLRSLRTNYVVSYTIARIFLAGHTEKQLEDMFNLSELSLTNLISINTTQTNEGNPEIENVAITALNKLREILGTEPYSWETE